jgi:hypothetical protein
VDVHDHGLGDQAAAKAGDPPALDGGGGGGGIIGCGVDFPGGLLPPGAVDLGVAVFGIADAVGRGCLKLAVGVDVQAAAGRVAQLVVDVQGVGKLAGRP